MLQSTKPIRRKSKSEPTFLDPASIDTRFYGLQLTGNCLDPEFKDGDLVVFDRDAKIEAGCFANFFYRAEVVPPGQLSVALKRVVFAPPPFVKLPFRDHPDSTVIPLVIVEQFNPARQWSIRMSDLLAVHRCLGSASDPSVIAVLEAEGWRV